MPVDPAFNWERVLGMVREEKPGLYRSWFDTLEVGPPHAGQLVIRASDPAQVHYLETDCRQAFTEAAMRVTGHLLSITFACTTPTPSTTAPTRASRVLGETPLNVDYTLEQFVVGPSNRLAHAACLAVCSQPGALYNPLFVHGASGLGKTHLLQAVCAEVRRASSATKASYVTCEAFVNDLVQAIAAGELHSFRESTRAVDLLVIDDVQFLANRESSQEELFHTFNALHQARKQIILSADKPPSEIPTLEDRLISRFNWGLVVQIDPPTRETRQAILHKKASLRGVEIPDEVVDLIAQHVQANIRLLEGALTKLITAVQLDCKPLNVDTAREVLAAYLGHSEPPLHISAILEAVSKYFGIRLQDLLGRRRTRSINHPRQIAMYLARKLTNLSLGEIGMHFGGRDHSTVLHAEQTIDAERTQDPKLAQTLAELTSRLSRHS